MKKAISIAIVIFALLIIKSLLSSIYGLWYKEDLLFQVQKELTVEKKRHEALKRDLSRTTSPEYIERQARNRLFFVRPGEQEVIIPPALLKPEEVQRLQMADTRPNWQKWWDVFF